ncbi:MAG: hypothetical protein RMK57_02655 [Bryobacterales bacterium]|nr:hypothetical protein [Bryobacterales bacterium]
MLPFQIDPEGAPGPDRAWLVKPGLLEIEWPRERGEEIPVE